ncbi:MAG: N-succinylarginine dihydrolase, partial [Planctomycetota bacterium]
LDPAHVVLTQQHPAAIDAGVFHHDVIGVGHRERLFLHQQAFADPAATRAHLDRAAHALHLTLRHATIANDQLPVDQAVATYLFNSQIVSTPDGRTILIAPAECEAHAAVRAAIDHAIASPQDQRPFDAAEFVDVRQSMRNGGGPACLRLRVVMTPAQRAAANAAWLTPALYDQLGAWVDRHYPDATTLDTLADPAQLRRNLDALDALAPILNLTDAPWHQQITDCANRWLG